jgi:hypothetical protein
VGGEEGLLPLGADKIGGLDYRDSCTTMYAGTRGGGLDCKDTVEMIDCFISKIYTGIGDVEAIKKEDFLGVHLG